MTLMSLGYASYESLKTGVLRQRKPPSAALILTQVSTIFQSVGG